MLEDTLAVSVIIPTHNRVASLRQTLEALGLQTHPLSQVEVVVVADGCTDGTVEFLQHYETPFTLQVIDQHSCGPAAARNHGAARARGQLLIFLDDDIEATPKLIETHVQAHQAQPNQVVIGYLQPVFQDEAGFLQTALQRWWKTMFDRISQPDYRFSYSDLVSGNFSLEAGLFTQVEGFHSELWCHEDYELGVRLLKAGTNFTFAVEALSYHHEKVDVGRALQRKYQEGRADVLLGHRHPELRSLLPLAEIKRSSVFLRFIVRTLTFSRPGVGGVLTILPSQLLNLMEQLRLYWGWRRLLDGLYSYWYWRGVAAELGNWQALDDFWQDASPYAKDANHSQRGLTRGVSPSKAFLSADNIINNGKRRVSI